jgi:hypothetical protein
MRELMSQECLVCDESIDLNGRKSFNIAVAKGQPVDDKNVTERFPLFIHAECARRVAHPDYKFVRGPFS